MPNICHHLCLFLVRCTFLSQNFSNEHLHFEKWTGSLLEFKMLFMHILAWLVCKRDALVTSCCYKKNFLLFSLMFNYQFCPLKTSKLFIGFYVRYARECPDSNPQGTHLPPLRDPCGLDLPLNSRKDIYIHITQF